MRERASLTILAIVLMLSLSACGGKTKDLY